MSPSDRQSESAGFAPGTHWLAEFTGVPVDGLTDVDRVLRGFGESLEVAGFTVLGRQSHRFDGGGFTGLFLLSESHASIHTWPERGYAAVDLFTCGRRDARPVFEDLRRLLGAGELELQAHERDPGGRGRVRGVPAVEQTRIR